MNEIRTTTRSKASPPAKAENNYFKPSRWKPICDEILEMKPGESFGINDAEKRLSKDERHRCISFVRGWMKREGIEGVEIYRTDEGRIWVKSTTRSKP